MKGETLISAVFVTLIVLITSIIILGIVNPTFEKGKDFQKYNEAKNSISSIDNVISELSAEASGSRRTIKISTEGLLELNSKEDSIKIKLEQPKFIQENTVSQEGNIVISSGQYVKAYEKDINNDGNIDLVLENNNMIFVLNKTIGFINTTNIVILIRNKNLDINMTPKSGIFINNLDNSSYGSGSIELTQKGEYLQSASIKLTINSISGISYESLFKLTAGMDFVELEVKKI